LRMSVMMCLLLVRMEIDRFEARDNGG
jgi:hypothetical protein